MADTAPPTDDTPAGQTGPAGADTDPTPDSNTDSKAADEGQDHDDNDDDPAVRKARREAAGLRKRLREAESERDQLDAHRQDVINEIATEAGLPDPGLLAHAGYELDGFITDDGKVDRGKLTGACRDVMQRYNIAKPRPPVLPNPQQGYGGGPRRHPAAEWKAAFAPRPR